MHTKVKIILNPAAGRVSPEKYWPEIQKFLEKHHVEYNLEKTTARGEGTKIAKKAVAEGYKTVLAVGGDGTANEVVNGLLGSDVAFGIIPCGEGNDFCKLLGFPPGGVKEALTAVIKKHTLHIDLGMVNGRAFLNMVGIGLDGEIAALKDEASKYMKGILVYAFHLLPMVMGYKPQPLDVEMSGLFTKGPIALIGIGNGCYEGGIFKLTPDAELDDGLLDVCIARYPGKLMTLWAAFKAIKGNHKDLPFVTMFKTEKITITAEKPLPAHIDGEVIREKKLEIKVLPKQLKIFTRYKKL